MKAARFEQLEEERRKAAAEAGALFAFESGGEPGDPLIQAQLCE